MVEIKRVYKGGSLSRFNLGAIEIALCLCFCLVCFPALAEDNSIPETSIEVRVAPLLKSHWTTSPLPDCNRSYTNYYTPPGEPGDPQNYSCGGNCLALAQIMRYFRYPDEPNALPEYYSIEVDEQQQEAQLFGGPYQWDMMQDTPDCNSTDRQLEAIGILCHDIGVALETNYTHEASITFYSEVITVLQNTFFYENAVLGSAGYTNLEQGLQTMILPNLDANQPVMVALRDANTGGSHAAVCDGYGFDQDGHLVLHLLLGRKSERDGWYRSTGLIVTGNDYTYDGVCNCIYNISPAFAGEIISGRVLAPDRTPSLGTEVSLYYQDQMVARTATNEKGIYAFLGCSANTEYTVTVEAFDYSSRKVSTGSSLEDHAIAGNRWKIDFPALPTPSVLFVNAGAVTGENNGLSWENAYLDLQSAITQALHSGGQTREIWVAQGVYRPDSGSALRTKSFILADDLAIYGGFQGHETEIEQRDPLVNVTILSGDLNGDDLSSFQNCGDNSYHIVFSRCNSCTAILDGFVITGACADGSTRGLWSEKNGGGIFISHGNPSISNCIFKHNYTEQAGGGGYCVNADEPLFVDCQFISNEAELGGGFYAYGANTIPQFLQCIFQGNEAQHSAGGLFCMYSTPVVVDSHFINNTGVYGGAIRNYEQDGTAFYLNTVFQYNRARAGAAIHNYNSDPYFVSCRILGNNASDMGGGMYHYDSDATYLNSIFIGNTAHSYGSVFTSGMGSFVNLQNCSVVSNMTYLDGPAIKNVWYGQSFIGNCILWNNHSITAPGPILQVGGLPRLRNTCIQYGLPILKEQDGNMKLDPLFLRLPNDGGDGWGDNPDTPSIDEAANDDFGNVTLAGESPCINTGDNYWLPQDVFDIDGDGDTEELLPQDLEGRTRIGGTGVDMGAIEFQGN